MQDHPHRSDDTSEIIAIDLTQDVIRPKKIKKKRS